MIDDKHRKPLLRILNELIESASRKNLAKPQRYWYPLSQASYGTEEMAEAIDSMVAFRTSMWEKTAKFEEAFASWIGCREAVMVNSGSSADLLASFLLTDPQKPLLRPGDEILLPAVTWPTQVWAPMMAGLRVRFVDVDPATLNISVEDLERKIGERTRALFLVHLMGNPCRMEPILALARRHSLIVLEDCCEALGSEWRGKKVGKFGLAATFSFFFSHHITTMEGGMIATDDLDASDRLRILRAHGWLRNTRHLKFDFANHDVDDRYAFVGWGFNVRPTELQAGFGLHQLEKLPAFNARRKLLSGRFFDFIRRSRGLSCPAVEPEAAPSWMALPVMVAADAPFTRADITGHLEKSGVETRPIVAGNLLRQPAARLFPDLSSGELPGSDAVHARGFYVGLSPFVTDAEFDRLLGIFDSFIESRK
ncbi:MAG: DegT/DnrJ/EryC1/StrS [Planctomycetota bacterium]|nr:MAG: DegT/DnrJ/EryC1/StrS [Planctomycetota bacterium]